MADLLDRDKNMLTLFDGVKSKEDDEAVPATPSSDVMPEKEKSMM